MGRFMLTMCAWMILTMSALVAAFQPVLNKPWYLFFVSGCAIIVIYNCLFYWDKYRDCIFNHKPIRK